MTIPDLEEKLKTIGLVPPDSPVLRTKSSSTDERHCFVIGQYAPKIFEFMREKGGIGLAANQIGITLRFFIIKNEIFINPKITRRSKETVRSVEGCLSFPGYVGSAIRHKSIDIEYQTIMGEVKTVADVKGLQAICFQHELDHINGIVIKK